MCKIVFKSIRDTWTSSVFKNATRRDSSGIFKKSQSDNFTEGVFKNIIKKLYLY
jgi:hypothetical protein